MYGSQKQMLISTICFGLALALLVATYLYNQANLSKREENARLLESTFQIKAHIKTLAAWVRDAERGQRGYLLTKDQRYLDNYKAAIQNEEMALKSINRLIQKDTVQQQNLAKLDFLIHERLNALQQVLNAHALNGSDTVGQLIASGPGGQLMTAIHTQVNDMLQEEDNLLIQRQRELTESERKVSFFTVVMFGLALLLLISAFSYAQASNRKMQILLNEKNRYAELLEKSNQELAMVAVIASHDLKAPMRKISFFTEEILKDPGNALTSDSRDLFQRIQAAAEKMQSLIEHILNIAKRENTELQPEPVNLTQVAQEVIGTLEPLIQETQGKVEMGQLCAITGDQSQITQLLQNLVENALKYHQPGVPPVVQITAQATRDKSFEIRVKDNGIGMDREHQLTAFQIFRRLPGAKPYAGTGVGLSNVKTIVERHRGSVKIKSAPGQGAEIIVKIPDLKISQPV